MSVNQFITYFYLLASLTFCAHSEPTVIPTGIRVKPRTKRSAIVKWDLLPSFKAEHIQMILIVLKLAVNPFEDLPEGIELDKRHIYKTYDELTGTEVLIRHLLPGTAYELRIAAVNEEGTGPLSSLVTFTTKRK